jgi:MFS family permease
MGAAIAIASILFLYLFLTEKPRTDRHDKMGSMVRSWFNKLKAAFPHPRKVFRLILDRDFASLVLFQSIPNKICLIGFVYYLAPLFLRDLGNNQSDTGRYVMGYSLVMILFSQTFSRWSDRRHFMKNSIFWGGALSGVALIPFFFFANTLMVVLGIVLLGMAHALSVTNQAKFASQLGAMQQIGLGQGLGIYRQAERVGNVLAPILLGVLISIMGYAKSLALIGVYTVISSLLFLFVSRKHLISE